MRVPQCARADIDAWIQPESAASPVLTAGARPQSDLTRTQWDEACIAALKTASREHIDRGGAAWGVMIPSCGRQG